MLTPVSTALKTNTPRGITEVVEIISSCIADITDLPTKLQQHFIEITEVRHITVKAYTNCESVFPSPSLSLAH
jgi:hypothetical protein